MEFKEAYKILRENRTLKGKKVKLTFRRADGTPKKFSATRRVFFVEENLVRKLLRQLKKTKMQSNGGTTNEADNS